MFHVRDIKLADASDGDILAYARQDEMLVISRDLDFANIILHPLDTHAGTIVLRVPPHFTAEEINKVLRQFLSVANMQSLSHALTIVEPGQFRVRR